LPFADRSCHFGLIGAASLAYERVNIDRVSRTATARAQAHSHGERYRPVDAAHRVLFLTGWSTALKLSAHMSQ
jgi:hypothetical protein